MPVAVAAPVILHDPAYRLDAGDRLRIVVFGQEGLTNSYSVDAAGVVTMPLIGSVPARGCTPAELAAAITARLQGGFIREPYVAVEIEAYRPFFILGEVAAPGQYPYVPNMTAEAAVAIAGGFTPRAKRNVVTITRTSQMGQTRIVASPQRAARRRATPSPSANAGSEGRTAEASLKQQGRPRGRPFHFVSLAEAGFASAARHFARCLAKKSSVRVQAVSALFLS